MPRSRATREMGYEVTMPTKHSSLAIAVTLALGALAHTSTAHAQCDHMTRPIAARIANALQPAAPAWARTLLTPAQLVRFDAGSYHPMTFFIGYSTVTIERLGLAGAAPFRATIVVRCRDRRAEVVSDPYAWANARARELHLQIANAEQAAGYAAEVATMSTGHRPEGASASRRAGVFRAEITFLTRQGESTPAAPLHLDVTREAEISQSASAAP